MSLFKKLFLSKINVKKYHINEDEIRKLSSLILKEEYKNFENYIFLFYNDNEKYEKKISENTDIWNSDNEQKSIYQAMKSFALYNKKAVFYYKEDIFQNNLEWNKVGEVFDFLFEDVLDNEIILEILRKYFFCEEEYTVGRFFNIINEVLVKNDLRMYFLEEESGTLLFFILEKKDEKVMDLFKEKISKEVYTIHSITEYL